MDRCGQSVAAAAAVIGRRCIKEKEQTEARAEDGATKQAKEQSVHVRNTIVRCIKCLAVPRKIAYSTK